MGVTDGDRVACVATIDLSKAPPAITSRDPASEGLDEAEPESEQGPNGSNGARGRRGRGRP
jgi:hypothetical protein